MLNANPRPPPAAAPLIAPMKTVDDLLIRSNKGCKCPIIPSTKSPIEPSSIALSNLSTGPPAEKNLPLPVKTTAFVFWSCISPSIVSTKYSIVPEENVSHDADSERVIRAVLWLGRSTDRTMMVHMRHHV